MAAEAASASSCLASVGAASGDFRTGAGNPAIDIASRLPFVELRDVWLEYPSATDTATVALRSLNLRVPHGGFAAIVGPSGCGKSTILKLIAGLLLPTAGTVRVAGAEVQGPIDGVGMAFQASTLLPWRSTLANVLLPLEIAVPYRHAFKQRRREYEARALALLELVGLGDCARKSPWQLSGGMQQRANLCRALIHRPSLLLLDEPFGALDTFTREDLWGVLQRLRQEQEFTAVLITHDLREAVHLADEVHVLGNRPGSIIHTSMVPHAGRREPGGEAADDFAARTRELRAYIEAQREKA